MLRANVLRCLRDPNFERHEWHAGHISKGVPDDPRKVYENRERRKAAGRRAWEMVLDWEKNWGPKLTGTQRHMLHVFVMAEVLTQRLHERPVCTQPGMSQ